MITRDLTTSGETPSRNDARHVQDVVDEPRLQLRAARDRRDGFVKSDRPAARRSMRDHPRIAVIGVRNSWSVIRIRPARLACAMRHESPALTRSRCSASARCVSSAACVGMSRVTFGEAAQLAAHRGPR
jgi:hypothetical protein